jgi:hypothetical protein
MQLNLCLSSLTTRARFRLLKLRRIYSNSLYKNPDIHFEELHSILSLKAFRYFKHSSCAASSILALVSNTVLPIFHSSGPQPGSFIAQELD